METQDITLHVHYAMRTLVGTEGEKEGMKIVCSPVDIMGRVQNQHRIHVYVGVGEGKAIGALVNKLDKGYGVKVFLKLKVLSLAMFLDETETHANGFVYGFWQYQR